ncbi:MAG: aminoglycoside phosphotransferase family protein [Deltaproteobacteria bacterium]|nr:aminoglycoside phosphotransferase family protein [Deltaproteobacteria bacterium]
MGTREVEFYRAVAPTISMRVPECHFAAPAPTERFLMLLEDLAARGCAISDGSWAIPGRRRAGVEELAELHVRWEDRAPRGGPALGDLHAGQGARIRVRTLRYVIDHCADRLSDGYLEVARLYIDHHDAIEAAWARGPQTLIHGDAHIGNLFIDGDRVGFLDWGMAKIGTPMRDLGFFLTMGLESEDRRAKSARSSGTISTPPEAPRRQSDRLRRGLGAHRIEAAYSVIASFLSLVPPYNTEARRMFTTNFPAPAPWPPSTT